MGSVYIHGFKKNRTLCFISDFKELNETTKNNGNFCFISDFREVHKRTKKPFPIPKMQDLLLKLEGFKKAPSLDLNMGYYYIKLYPFSIKLWTIVLPWGNYEYQKLSMGLCNSPDIFQEKMKDLFNGLDYVRI